jgi:signal transduction histidine kinase
MEGVWLQFVITGGAVVTTLFFTIRYLSLQNSKREKQAQDYHTKMQQMQYEYYETKNGHMERMANTFTQASNKMSKAVNGLSQEIKTLSSVHKKK